MLLNFTVDDSNVNKKKREGLSITEIIDMSKNINSDWIQQEAEKKLSEKHKNKERKPHDEEGK